MDKFDREWNQLMEGNEGPIKRKEEALGSFDEYLEFCLKYEPELLTAFRNKDREPIEYAAIRDATMSRIKADYQAAEGRPSVPEPEPKAAKTEPAEMSDLEFQRQWSILRGHG